MKSFFFSIILFGFFLFPVKLIYAFDVPKGLTVNPAFEEIVLDTETKTKDFFIFLQNTTDTTMILRIKVLDFGSLDESGGVAFLGATNDVTKKYALASWIRPETDVVILEPGESKKILITIENRESLSSGGHYGALTFQRESNTSSDIKTGEDTVAINQLFSALLFVKKIGGEIYHLDLKEWKYQNNHFSFQNNIQLRFQNSGNVHLVPRGTVIISDPFNRVVAKGVINEESAIILPETFRIYTVVLRNIAFSFVPGKYTAEISYRYDGQEIFSTSSFSFDFFPFPATLGSLIFIGGLSWYVARYWKKRKKRKISVSTDTH